ncbi:MAG: TIM barrel protein [Dehalococcoidia bacterium]
MARLYFGTAGAPVSTRAPSTTPAGIERIRELGLDAMEVQFVQGVRMGEGTALLVRETAARHGVHLSAHAPYYVNFNAHEPEKLTASEGRLLQAARVAALCGARNVVVHTAFYLGDPAPVVLERVRAVLEKLTRRLKEEGTEVLIRPELMGKPSQFGTLEELLALSAEVPGVAPALDFSHFHARTGGVNSYSEFVSVLDMVEAKLGRAALEDLHIHLSGIKYGPKGELKHLVLRESDMEYEALLRALKDREAGGLLICESPNLEEDALLLQETYEKI